MRTIVSRVSSKKFPFKNNISLFTLLGIAEYIARWYDTREYFSPERRTYQGAKIYRRNSIIVGEHVGRARVFEPTANFAANEFTTRSTLSWTTEGINNAVKYFMDFAECGCQCTVTSCPSVAIGPTSIVNGNKRAPPAASRANDVDHVYAGAMLTGVRTARTYTRYLQIPALENRAPRFASVVSSGA